MTDHKQEEKKQEQENERLAGYAVAVCFVVIVACSLTYVFTIEKNAECFVHNQLLDQCVKDHDTLIALQRIDSRKLDVCGLQPKLDACLAKWKTAIWLAQHITAQGILNGMCFTVAIGIAVLTAVGVYRSW